MNIPKKPQPLKRSPSHSGSIRLSKHGHSSLEGRDENTRPNYCLKKSKDKIVKQPSMAYLKTQKEETTQNVRRTNALAPTGIYQNARRSAANVREVEFSLVDKNDDYRSQYYNTLKDIQIQDVKGIGKSYSQKQFHIETIPDQNAYTRTLQDETAIANSNSTRSIVTPGNNPKVLKCHYHPIKDAKYLVQLNDDEDILCCMECGSGLKVKGFKLEEISSLKSKRNYEVDEFLQRSLQSMETLKKCLSHLPQYHKQITVEIKEQINIHQSYYKRLIDIIQARKEESQRVLMNSLNTVTEYFNALHKQLHQQLTDLETSYNQIIVNREEIKKISEADFHRVIAKQNSRLSIPRSLTNPQLQIWKVEVGDVAQFQKDLENYIVRIEEQEKDSSLSRVTSLQNTVEKPEPIQEQQSSLLCQEQFEWGYKPPKQPLKQPDNKDIYFSFQKKSREESVSSPAFKQI